MLEPFIMAEFRRADYNRIVKKLEYCADRMTIRKAINRASIRAAEAGATFTKRAIASEVTLKTSEIGKRIKVYKYGSPLDMVIGLKISDTVRPVSDYSFTPKKPTRNKAPVVEIYKGKKHTLDRGAFVQQMPSRHIGVFERTSKKSLPIRAVPGPSVTGLFKANENLHRFVWDRIFETLEERIDHEVGRLLNG